MALETKEEVATMLRSVLSSEKNGVPLRVLEHEYKVLIGSCIPYRNMGYSTLGDFLKSLPDVVRLSRGPTGEPIAKAVVTESTLHVAQMVAGQKSTKSKPIMRSMYRHPISQHYPGYRPINVGYREHRHPVTSSRLPPRGSGIRGVYQPRRFATTARGKPQEHPPRRPGLNKQYESSSNSRRSSFDMPTRFRKSQSGSDSERYSPDSWEDTTSKHSKGRREHNDTTWGTGGEGWHCDSKWDAAKKVDPGRGWGKVDNGSDWGKVDSGSDWGKVDNGRDWGKVDSGSDWGKVDSSSDWGKVDSGSDWGKVDSGSDWRKVNPGSDWEKVDSGSDWGKVDSGGGESRLESGAASWSSREEEASDSNTELCCEPKQEAVAKNGLNTSVSRWATWGVKGGATSVKGGFGDDVPLESIKRTVTISQGESKLRGRKEDSEGGRKVAEERLCRTPTVEPDQPRFDPFREGIRLREVGGAPQVSKEEDRKSPEEMPKTPTVPSPILEAASSTALVLPLAKGRTTPVRQTSVPSLQTSPLAVPAAAPSAWMRSLAVPSKPLFVTKVSETPFRKLVAQHASKHGLNPTYSALCGRSAKRGPITWLATLKLGPRSYNSYPNEKATEEEALEEAARKAVLALNLGGGTDAEFPVTPTSTKEEITVLENRVTELVAKKPRGLLNTSVPDLYRERFGETLPDSWLEHMARTNRVLLAEIDGNRCILYPRGTNAPSIASQNGHAPARPPADDELRECERRDEYVDVFITCITNTDNVCFRFIEYAEEYDQLTEEMNRFYGGEQHCPAGQLQAGELYAACVDGAWLRVQLVSPQRQQDEKVECYFVDQGDTEAVKVDDLYCLELRFRELPLQAIQCQLDGLVEYSACDRAVDVLVELLLGKTLVAEIVQKEDPVTVVLYNTWTEVDINLNLEVAVRLAEPLLPKLGRIGRAQLCHVTPSGDAYLQILGPGLDSLVQSMEIVNQYYENNNDPVGRLESGRLYTCRYTGDHKFYRVMLQSTEPQMSGKFSVLYVDYGNEDSVFVAELRDLDIFGDFVMRLPHQAVRCRLDGVLEGKSWTELATSKLWDAVADSSELLVKVTKPASEKEVALVALFRRIEPNKELISINTALALSLSGAQGARS